VIATENAAELFDKSWNASDDSMKQQIRKKIIDIAPDSEYGLFSRAYFAEDKKEAVRLFTEAIAIRADFWQAYVSRARLHMDLEQFEEAIHDFKEALLLNPKYEDDYVELALCIHTLYEKELRRGVPNAESLHEALHFVNKAIAKENKEAFAYYLRANIKFYLSDIRGAIGDYDKAIARDSKLSSIWSGRAAAHCRLQEISKCESDINTAIKLDPKNYHAFFIRGTLRAIKKQKQSACKDLSFAGENGIKEAYEIIKAYCQ